MRPDLGRLAACAEIVQIGPALAGLDRPLRPRLGCRGADDSCLMDDQGV